MRILWLIIITSLISGGIVAQDGKQEQFIINALSSSNELDKKSRGSLKESLGEEVRDAVHTTIKLMDIVGDLQMMLSRRELDSMRGMIASKKENEQELFFSCYSGMHLCVGEVCKSIASLQRLFSSMLEKLLDNKAPFKRATMPALKSVVHLVRDSHYQLNSQVRALKGIIHLMKKNETQKGAAEGNEAIKQNKQMLDEQKDTIKKICANLEQDKLIKQV